MLFYQIIHRDLLLAYRQRMEYLTSLLFFIIVVALFPLAITPDTQLLHTIAPGLIWVAALLSSLLSLDNLFRHDYEDGSLSQLLLSNHPLPLLVLGKVIAHWLVTGLPLIILTPVLALLLHLTINETTVLLIVLLLGTPTLSLIGAIGSALTLGLRNSNLLLSLLVLPLCAPILIFGAGAVVNMGSDVAVRGQISLLASFLILAICFAPLAAAAGLRLAEE